MLVRVVMDTCVIRNHLHKLKGCFNPNKHLDFEAIHSSTEQLRFSLAAGAFVELLNQLTDAKRKPAVISGLWGAWVKEIKGFDSILDPRWPILPDRRELASLAGTVIGTPIDVEEEMQYLQSAWGLFRHAKCAADLLRGTARQARGGHQYALKLELRRIEDQVAHERKFWSTYIRNALSALANLDPASWSVQAIVELMREGQGGNPGEPSDLSYKLDTINHVIADRLSRAMKKKEPYNPDSRPDDAFDVPLLFYIPLPSVICTADTTFVNQLKCNIRPRPLHVHQVVSVKDFNRLVKENNVGELVRDFRTPEEQHRQWSEAAYFNWLNRGRPLNDDQKDWFDAEPIA